MLKYMVNVMIPFIPENVKMQVLKDEQEKIKELKIQNIVEFLFVSDNLNSAWMIINSENREDVDIILQSLPIYRYLYIDKIVKLRSNLGTNIDR